MDDSKSEDTPVDLKDITPQQWANLIVWMAASIVSAHTSATDAHKAFTEQLKLNFGIDEKIPSLIKTAVESAFKTNPEFGRYIGDNAATNILPVEFSPLDDASFNDSIIKNIENVIDSGNLVPFFGAFFKVAANVILNFKDGNTATAIQTLDEILDTTTDIDADETSYVDYFKDKIKDLPGIFATIQQIIGILQDIKPEDALVISPIIRCLESLEPGAQPDITEIIGKRKPNETYTDIKLKDKPENNYQDKYNEIKPTDEAGFNKLIGGDISDIKNLRDIAHKLREINLSFENVAIVKDIDDFINNLIIIEHIQEKWKSFDEEKQKELCNNTNLITAMKIFVYYSEKIIKNLKKNSTKLISTEENGWLHNKLDEILEIIRLNTISITNNASSKKLWDTNLKIIQKNAEKSKNAKKRTNHGGMSRRTRKFIRRELRRQTRRMRYKAEQDEDYNTDDEMY